MRPVHIIGLVLLAVLCALVWLAYDQITVIRGTVFWEFRYLLLGVVVFVVLSLVQWLWGKLADKAPPEEAPNEAAEEAKEETG